MISQLNSRQTSAESKLRRKTSAISLMSFSSSQLKLHHFHFAPLIKGIFHPPNTEAASSAFIVSINWMKHNKQQ
jgi:hypothetical protein